MTKIKMINLKWYAVFRVLTLKKLYKKVLTLLIENVNVILVLERRANIQCGYYSKEDTPVPIPNTEVKLFSGDGTWWATAWESST